MSLAACNGDDGVAKPAQGFSSSPPVTTTQDPGGLYQGTWKSDTQNTTSNVAAVVDESGALQLVNGTNNTQVSGKLTTNLGSITGPLRFYDAKGALLTTGTFTGNVLTQSKLTGSYTAANGDHGSMVLAYDSDYTKPASLSTLAGNYYGNQTRNGQSSTLVVKADGTLSGISEYGCSYTGTLNIPDAHFNLARLSITAGASPDCGAASTAPVTGFAVYSPASGQQPATLDTLATNDSFGTFGGFDQSMGTATDFGGIYAGTLTFPKSVTHPILMAIVNGSVEIIDQTTYYLYSANLGDTIFTPGPGSFSGKFTYYDAKGQGRNTTSGSDHDQTFIGQLAQRSKITGTLTQYTGEQDTFSATFSKSLYEAPVTLATAAGSYAEASPRNGAQSSMTWKADGTFSGTTEFGCTFSGTATVRDGRYDMYSITVPQDGSNCLGGTSGTAYVVPASSSAPAGLVVAFSDYTVGRAINSYGYWAIYKKQ